MSAGRRHGRRLVSRIAIPASVSRWPSATALCRRASSEPARATALLVHPPTRPPLFTRPLPPCGLELLAWESPWFSLSCFRARVLGRACAGRAFRPADRCRFGCFCLLSVGGFCFVPPPPQPAPLGLHQASLIQRTPVSLPLTGWRPGGMQVQTKKRRRYLRVCCPPFAAQRSQPDRLLVVVVVVVEAARRRQM